MNDMGIIAGIISFVKKKHTNDQKGVFFIKAKTKRVGIIQHDRADSFSITLLLSSHRELQLEPLPQ